MCNLMCSFFRIPLTGKNEMGYLTHPHNINPHMYLTRCATYHKSKLRQYSRVALRPLIVPFVPMTVTTSVPITPVPITPVPVTPVPVTMYVPATATRSNNTETSVPESIMPVQNPPPDFTREMLVAEWYRFINGRITEVQLKKRGIPIRCANTPEHISENIVKFIIRTHGGDPDVQWAKMVGKTGDLFSPNCIDVNYQYEVKSITSAGPISFSPTKKFCRLYVLDLRNMMKDRLVLWCVNVSSDSDLMKNLKINKTQTKADQSLEKRRPRLGWDMMYRQLQNECTMVYDGTFEGIFDHRA